MSYLKRSQSSRAKVVVIGLLLAGLGLYALLQVFAGGETVRESFDEASGWSSSPALVGQATADTENKLEGVASTKLATAGVPNVVFTKSFSASMDLSSVQKISIGYYFPVQSGLVEDGLTEVEMRLGTGANYFSRTHDVTSRGVWLTDEAALSAWVAVGEPAWTNISEISFVFSGITPSYINVDSLSTYTPVSTVGPAVVTVTERNEKKQTALTPSSQVEEDVPSNDTAETAESDQSSEPVDASEQATDYSNLLWILLLSGVLLIGLGAQMGWGVGLQKQLRKFFR